MRSRLVLLLLGLAAVLPAAAEAAETRPVVVARDGSLLLAAREDEDGELCLAFDVRGDGDDECGDPATGVALVASGGSAGTALGAAVPASATRIEVRRGGRLLAAGATEAGAVYRGVGAGEVRFAVVHLPDEAPEDGLRVRALDGAGTLVAVVTSADRGALTTRRATLLSGRSGATTWALRTSTVTRATPSIVDPARESVQECLSVEVRGLGGVDPDCRPPSDEDVLLGSILGSRPGAPALEDLCKERFRLLHGAAPVGTRAVRAELGDGRLVPARLAPYPAAGTVAYALVLPPGAALRAVRLRRADGTQERVTLRSAPLDVICRAKDARLSASSELIRVDPGRPFLSALDRTPVIVPAGPVTEVPGDPGFRVADGPDGKLCVAVAGQPLRSFGCGPVTAGYGDLVTNLDSFERPRGAIVVVPAAVAAVRLGRRAGALRTVATVGAEGYTGNYAGRVRFLATRLRGLDDADRVVYLDAAGRVLHREVPDPSDQTLTEQDVRAAKASGPRRVAGAPARPSLWQTTYRGGLSSSTSCLALTDGGSPGPLDRCQASRSERLSVIVRSSCATRRLTVAVVAGAGSRASLTATSGSRSTIGLRGGVGLLTLGPRDGVRDVAVSLPGGRTQHAPLRAPAGAEQCGWTSTVSLPTLDRTTSGPAPEGTVNPV